MIRLRDFGVPDFATIKAPSVSGEELVFYAVDETLGVPYKVECAQLTGTPTYEPVPLTALPRPAEPVNPNDVVHRVPNDGAQATKPKQETPQ